jgi:5'-nucleotidase
MIRSRATVVLAALALVVTACSSDSKSTETTAAPVAAATTEAAPTTEASATTEAPETTEAPATTDEATTEAPTTEAATTEAPTTTEAAKILEVLVTNDDGFDAPGMDAVIEYLRSRPDMHVSVWAPLTNQSGAGDKTTDGAPPAVTDVMTLSGYPAKAVAGFPADAVNAALNGGLDVKPDLIISGSNLGQNYGPLTLISGTVGAAATGARTGIPAIAISQGFPAEGAEFDFPASVAVLTTYLDAAITSYAKGIAPALVSINVPTCPVGVEELPIVDNLPSATGDNGRQLGAPTACDGNPTTQLDDVDAFNAGHPTITQIDPTTLLGVTGP